MAEPAGTGLTTPYDQVPQELFGDGGYVRDRLVECSGVDPRRLAESAHLAYVLQRCGSNLFLGRRRLGTPEGLDASTHGPKLASRNNYRRKGCSPLPGLQGIAHRLNPSRDVMRAAMTIRLMEAASVQTGPKGRRRDETAFTKPVEVPQGMSGSLAALQECPVNILPGV